MEWGKSRASYLKKRTLRFVSKYTTKAGYTFEYRPPSTRFDHRYSAIRARSDRISVSCLGGGGFLVMERALSIAVAGNSINRNINVC